MSQVKKNGIEWIFKSVNSPILKEELISIQDYAKENEMDVSFLETFCNHHDLSMNDFYYAENHEFSPFCYLKGAIFESFMVLNQEYLETEMFAEGFLNKIKKLEELIQMENFEELMLFTTSNGQQLVFESIYFKIPKSKRYKMFMDMYVLQDYGMASYSKDIIKDVILHQPKATRTEALRELKKTIQEKELVNGMIFVYRGMGDESTPLEQAMSWTIDEKTAYFFANRLGRNGRVVRGMVHLNNVIDYITQRSESEIIVLPEHVALLEQEQMVETTEELTTLTESGLISIFQTTRDAFIKMEHYEAPHGVHGTGHVTRVLLHCLSLANTIGLSEIERGILSVTACYHDIGRTHEDDCREHGKWSVEKMYELNLETFYISHISNNNAKLGYLNEQEVEAVEFLMEFHCVSDDEAETKLGQIQDEYTQSLIRKLYPIFKDADALDRVRIQDLDVQQLRTKEARQRIKFANDTFKFIK